MAKEKYLKKVIELFEKSPVVDFNSIKRIIKNSNYTKQFIRNLILKGKIKKLAKGFYTSKNDPSLIVFCFKPAYLGLQDALSMHNLWEQETIPIIISMRKIRTGIRKINNSNVLIRRIDKKYLFGYDYLKVGEFYFPYSDIEKTLIDMVYFKQKLNKETIKNIKNKINKPKLKKYLRNYPKLIRKRVNHALNQKKTFINTEYLDKA